MKNEHAVLSRDVQVELGKKLCVLCEKEHGVNFSHEFQGSGPVVILKIAGSDPKLINKMRSYLWGVFKLTMEKPRKNHGRGMKATILVNLSEISQHSVDSITDAFRKAFNGEGVKKIQQIVVEDKSVLAVIEEPTTEAVLPKRRIKKRDEGHYAITVAISSVFRFEKLSPDFSCKKIGNLYEVLCSNKQVADSVEKILNWRINDSNLVVRNDNTFIVDYIGNKKENRRSTFCFPPIFGKNQEPEQVVDDIKKRLMKINLNSRPIISFLKEGEFLVTYVKSVIAPKIYSIILSMGWNVKENNANSFYIYSDRNDQSTLPEEQVNHNVPYTSRDDFDLNIPMSPGANHLFNLSKDGALLELKRIYKDPELSANLSDETKNDIHFLLEEEWKKQNTEEYARVLLDILKK
jgi:hypothetical protein